VQRQLGHRNLFDVKSSFMTHSVSAGPCPWASERSTSATTDAGLGGKLVVRLSFRVHPRHEQRELKGGFRSAHATAQVPAFHRAN
jgi:hypothetical protein